MKVKQIVSEHKKGVRAHIYNKKATVKAQGAIPLYGPDKQEAKMTPYKPKKVNEADVTLKPLAGAQEVDIDGKPVGTATTPEAATAIKDLATKGEFTPASADGSTPKPMEEAGDDTPQLTPDQIKQLAPYLETDPADGSQYYDFPPTDTKEKGAIMGTTIKSPGYIAAIKQDQGKVIQQLLSQLDPKNQVKEPQVTTTPLSDEETAKVMADLQETADNQLLQKMLVIAGLR